MRNKFNLIEYAVKKGFKQKQIAEHLGVSSVQVTRWKTRDPIPEERREKIMQLLGYDDSFSSEWLKITDNPETQKKWIDLFQYYDEAEATSGFRLFGGDYSDCEFYVCRCLTIFLDIGCSLPAEPPAVPNFDEDEDEDEDNPFCEMLFIYLKEYDVLQWWLDCRGKLNNDPNLFEIKMDLDNSLPYFALRGIDNQTLKSAGADIEKVNSIVEEHKKEIINKLNEIIDYLHNNGITIPIDLFEIIDLPGEVLLDFDILHNILSPDDVTKCMSIGEKTIFESLNSLHFKLDKIAEKIGIFEDDEKNG